MESGALLIFDGDCGFCTSSAHWIEAKWKPGSAAAQPWQRLGLDRLTSFGLTVDDVSTKAWWVQENQCVGGERAVSAALIAAGGMWSVLGHLIGIPPFRWFARPGYRLVARYRYKLPGATPACRL